MHSEATLSLYSMVNRVAKLCSRKTVGNADKTCGILPGFAMLFKNPENRVKMTEISRHMMISKPAVTMAVDKLVDQGLVERVRDAQDRRVVYIQLTPLGKNKLEQEIEMRLAFVDRVVMRIGEADANRLVALLDCFLQGAADEMEES